MKSLKNIYENSNFYKEARIISFIDRLLDCIIQKIKQKVGINLSIIAGKTDYEAYSSTYIQHAKSILIRFQEVSFIHNHLMTIELLCSLTYEHLATQ